MTGSFVVGDTFNASIRRTAYTQLGPVDEIVSANGLAAAPVLASRLGSLRDPNVDGTLALVSTTASAASTTAPVRAAPKAQLLETDFAAARQFGGDPHATGISGPTPGAGERVRRERSRDRAPGEHRRHDRRVRLRRRGAPARAARAPEARRRRLLAGRRDRVGQHLRQSGNDRGHGRETHVAELPRPPQSIVLVSNAGGVEAGRPAHRRGRRRARVAARRRRRERERPKASGARPGGAQRAVAVAPVHVARRVRGVGRNPAPRQHLLHARRRAEVGARHAASPRPPAALARRRVRGRRMVLRGALRDRRNLRRPRSGPRAHGRGREAVLAARRRLAYRPALRVQVGQRATGLRRRFRHRDRHRRAHERLAESLQHHPGDP